MLVPCARTPKAICLTARRLAFITHYKWLCYPNLCLLLLYNNDDRGVLCSTSWGLVHVAFPDFSVGTDMSCA